MGKEPFERRSTAWSPSRTLWRCLCIVVLAVLGSGSASWAGVPFTPGSALVANDSNKVKETKSDGTSPQNLTIPNSTFAGDAGVAGAGGLAFDESFNYLYVTVSSISATNTNAGVVKIDAGGNIVTTFDRATAGFGSIDYRGAAVRTNVIYIATDSGIRRISATNGTSAGNTIGSGAFRDVAFDSAGNLYGMKNTSIVKFSGSDFGASTTVVSGGGSFFALAFDSADNLYLTETSGANANKVLKYNRNGDGTYSFAYAIARPAGYSGGQLFGIGADNQTNVFYVANTDTSKDELLTFTPTDTIMAAITGTSGINAPRFIEVHATPEPSTCVLFGSGVTALWLLLRRPKYRLQR